MTLKEKFQNIHSDYLPLSNNQKNECVLIADEFAIGFLEFTESTYSFGNIMGKWYLHADTSKQYTRKELLKIYKDKTGL